MQLTNACDTPHMGGEYVITSGLGRIDFKEPNNDLRLRQTQLVTIDSEYCLSQRNLNLDSIVCAHMNTARMQTSYKGDSGMVICFAKGE